MTDLQAKYQKLATEYSKLRAQVPVLKKAVLDELAKQDELKETIKERDQAMRQYEQETDSLMFRNRQLSTRVSLLQEELDRSDFKHSKHKHDKRNAVVHEPELSAGDSVLGEELKSKIEENARLHRQVFESVERHQQSENELQERVRRLSEEVSKQKQLFSVSEQEHKEHLNKLQSQKAKMEVQLQQQEKHLKEAQLKVNSLEAQLRSLPSSEPSRLQTNNSISVQETVFSDMKKQDNVVAGDVSWQQSREVTFEMETLIAALIHQLSNLYTYSKQRCTVHPPEIDCQPLGDVTTMDTANSLEEFALTLKSFVNHVTTLLPCQLLSIDDECRMSTCTESLETKNRQLQTSLKNFTSCLSNLETYISLLTAKSGTHGNQTTLSVDKLFEMLMQAGADFHNATTDLSKQFSIKVSLERQLPTATQKWKQTDDHITSTLEDLATCSSQLAAFLKDNLSLLCKVQSEVNLSVMSKPGGESGGDVIQNGQASVISTQCTDSLTLQVATLQERLCELEQDKEKWMLEMELQQMKYEKLQQKAVQLEETLQKMETQLSGDAMATTMTTSQSPMSTNEASTNRCHVSTSWLGKLKIEGSEEESETREELIKHYFSRRMAEVTSKLQTADSKALHFHTECGVLHNRLRLTLKDREKLQEELSMAKELVIQVKDELQTMTDGYKSQLSTMSEHLAGMNEKLTAQKDEIDMLKYQLHNVMTGKKGRGK